MTFYQLGHFVVLIMRNFNFISVQSWIYLEVVTSCYVKSDRNQESTDDVFEQALDYLAVNVKRF